MAVAAAASAADLPSVVITGASSGIGRATALLMGEQVWAIECVMCLCLGMGVGDGLMWKACRGT